MNTLLKFADTVNEQTGQLCKWLCVLLVAVLSFEVAMRYIFNSPTTWAHLTSMMTGGAIICLGLGYTHLHNSHIRIDVVYAKLSRRRQALIDVIMAVVFLLPLLVAFTSVSFSWMIESWATGEVRTESFWYPPAGYFRTAIFLGWVLFALQCIAQFVRDVYALKRGRP